MRKRLPLYLLLTALVLVAATWSTLLIAAPKQQTLDQRVQGVASQLKCVVCQGESVADSQAGLAQEMRLVIRDQLQQGKSDQEVLQYFVQRYGEDIIWSPPWQGFSLLVWLVPIVFWLGGVVLLIFLFREWRAMATRRRLATAAPEADEKRQGQTTIEEARAPELERYRAQLEAELAAEDVLFRRSGLEAN
jgi:cytochrome c-type biogenesis protein CcmH